MKNIFTMIGAVAVLSLNACSQGHSGSGSVIFSLVLLIILVSTIIIINCRYAFENINDLTEKRLNKEYLRLKELIRNRNATTNQTKRFANVALKLDLLVKLRKRLNGEETFIVNDAPLKRRELDHEPTATAYNQ